MTLKKKNKKIIELDFPLNNGGQETGISEGGIEHFTGKLVESLCKEILQNSLDARINNSQVTVEFKLLKIPSNEIPEIEALRETLVKCIDYWNDNEKAKKILTKSLNSLNQDMVEVLRVSDFGTCGLTGAKEKRNSNFFNLVKSSGASSKGGQSGGSFGIGKFAPFACSLPRTVFYSTLNKDNEYAFQGVSRLVTHEIKGKTTQGVGYIGDAEENMPITNKVLIPNLFIREKIGTDINIIGFNGKSSWKENIIKSSLMSFFESIYEGKLKIVVDDEVVDNKNLEKFGKKHLEKEALKDYTYEYFKCIISPESENKRIIKEDFIHKGENLGEIELHLLKERGFRKKVAFLRSTGMKIIDKGNFRTGMQFSGVLKLNGEKINSFIRSLETPAHDKLEIERHDDVNYAKNTLDSLNKFIREEVTKFGKLNEGEELDLKGLSKFLPDSSKENEILNYSLKNGKIKTITQEKYEKSKKTKQDDYGTIETEMVDEAGENSTPSKTPNDSPSDYVPIPGDDPKPRGEGYIDGEVTPKEIEIIKEKGKSPLRISKRKVLINDNKGKRYKVLIESLDDKNVYIRLKAKYEDGKSEIVKLKSFIRATKEVELSSDFIELNLKENKREVIFINLVEEVYSSMEVMINEK